MDESAFHHSMTLLNPLQNLIITARKDNAQMPSMLFVIRNDLISDPDEEFRLMTNHQII